MKVSNLFKLIILSIVVILIGCERSISYSNINKNNQSVQGEKIDLLNKKFLVINYWASWCPPCRKEIPELNSFYELHQSQVLVIGVNLEKINQPDLLTAIDSFGIKYPVINNDLMHEKLGISTEVYPATYIVDQHGKLIKTFMGPVTTQQLANYLV